MTSHNRRTLTLRCLEYLAAESNHGGIHVSVFLVDAGSTDGTARLVRERFPNVRVIEADSNTYWNRGMAIAFDAAKEGDFDYYLWLNDDTLLIKDALSKFLETLRQLRSEGYDPGILVGSTIDTVSAKLSYGGQRQCSRLNPLKLQRVEISSRPQRVDTMNGNSVLITRDATQSVGNLDWSFVHAMGDTDYGLRAKKLGVEIWTVPGVIGHCARNAIEGSWRDDRLPFRQRWRKLLGPKGLPIQNWLVITRRHGGPLWPILWVWPYSKLVIKSIVIWARSKVDGVRIA